MRLKHYLDQGLTKAELSRRFEISACFSAFASGLLGTRSARPHCSRHPREELLRHWHAPFAPVRQLRADLELPGQHRLLVPVQRAVSGRWWRNLSTSIPASRLAFAAVLSSTFVGARADTSSPVSRRFTTGST